MNDNIIKMFIGGEEVVSNKEFTINEEMLSASSTILNNCYPKSWEDNKDYTSDFYYPKDYSRFVLGQGEYLYGNDEFAVLEGKGYNLLDLRDGIYSSNGIVANVNNGEIVLNGVATANSFVNIALNTNLNISLNDVITLSMNNPVANSNVRFRIDTGGYLDTILNEINKVNTINITYATFTNGITIRVQSGTTLSNYILKPMIVEGNVSYPYNNFGNNINFDTNIEKSFNNLNIYGNTYQKRRSGKNLFNKNVYFNLNGASISVLDTGIKVTQTTSGTYRYVYAVLDEGSLLGKTITLSATMQASANNKPRIRLYFGTTGNPAVEIIKTLDTTGSTTVTIPSSFPANTDKIIILFYSNVDGTGNVGDYVNYNNVQVEIGSVPTTYENYGESPTPSYPSYIESVGIKNLFDINQDSIYSSGTVSQPIENGIRLKINVAYQYLFAVYKLIDVSDYVGEAFSIKVDFIASGTNNPRVAIGLCDENGGNRTVIENAESGTKTTIIIPTISNAKYLAVWLYATNNNVGVVGDYADFTNIMVVKGSTMYDYIPYGKYGIEIKNTGKNLFDKNTADVEVAYINSSTGAIISGGASTTIKYYPIQPNTQYTLSIENQQRLAFYNSNKTMVSIITTNNTTFTTPNNAYYVSIQAQTTTFDINTIQLEKGTQATTYTPYQENKNLYLLNEPLRAIDTYKDRLYYEGNVLCVERKIGTVYYKGEASEGWRMPSSNTDNIVIASANNAIVYDFNSETQRQLSNGYLWEGQASGYANALSKGVGLYTYITGGNKYIYLVTPKTIATNLSEFLSWLSNNNLEIDYVLTQPYTEVIGYIDKPIAYEGMNYSNLIANINASYDLKYYWKNYDVLFAGVVKNTGDISLNPRYPHYCNLQILDYKTFLSESNTLDFVIANKTVKEAIGMVVNAISGYGFILGEINIDSADDIIGAYSTLNKTAYDVLQYLANISGSRWRARYVDSSTMAIDFYDPDTLPQGANIEYTQEYWENNNIVDLTFNYGTRDYRNKQILLSDEVYANINYNETLISNGYTNTFTLQNNIGTVVNILVGNEEKTVATTNDKQMGIDADFYYAPGKNILESNSVYSAGTLIKITYQPLVKGRQIVYNTNEVDRISTQTDTEGVIARYENRNDILSSDELEKIAQTYIEYKGKAEVILTLTTRNNDLYNIGEVVYFDAPIPDLAQNYMVKTKKTEYIVIDEIVNLFYIYEMTSSFNSEKAINYFDNQRNKASGNIAEGDSITRNIDIETDVGIIWTGGTVSSASITVDGDNVLNSVLNSPFVE